MWRIDSNHAWALVCRHRLERDQHALRGEVDRDRAERYAGLTRNEPITERCGHHEQLSRLVAANVDAWPVERVSRLVAGWHGPNVVLVEAQCVRRER